jgi:hypothetical protein
MLQMTWGIIGDLERHRCALAGTSLRQKLGDIADLGAQLFGGLRADQAAVFLEQRAASSAVHNDEIALIRHCCYVGSGQGQRAVRITRMLVEGTAADLPGDFDYPVTVRFQRPAGGLVNMIEERIHDAATKQRNRWRGGRRQEAC